MKTTAPLSKSQYGIYAECVSHSGEVCYNLPYLYILDGSLDGETLCRAVEKAVNAHPTLFTRITLDDDGMPQQTIDSDNEQWQLQVEHIDDIETEKAGLVVPFDIYGDRLFHIRLMTDDRHFYLFLDYHHIIVDGTSMQVMLHDIDAAYQGKTLEPEQLTMADLARQEATPNEAAYDEAKQWYAQQFDCSDTYTRLTPDVEDGGQPVETSLVRKLDVSMGQVDAFCHQHSLYRSSFFTGAYAFLLAKYNNEREALFTTVVNGRSDKRFLHSVGMAVKTLPVYQKFDDDTSVVDFLKAGQEQMSGCRCHEAYGYSDVVSDLGLQSDTMFAWHGTLFSDDQLCGRPMRAIRLGNSTLSASLYLKAFILHDHYQVKAEYRSNEYSEAIICQFLDSYEMVIKGLLSKTKLADISLVSEQAVDVLDSFNQTDVDYDDSQTIVSLFRKQAGLTPDHIAVVYQDRRYTYAEVDALSDHIAAYIAHKGLQAEDVVSIIIPRCEWMAIASLGVLKAGCAYQPLDPSYPKERLNFMMQDAQAKLLIADEALRPLVDEYQGDVLLTRDLADIPPAKGLECAAPTPNSLFILLYTSGSTGVPKGCQLTHANLVAFCHWYQRFYRLTPADNVAAYASYGFDASMMDMYPALTCGATVHIIAEELRLDLLRAQFVQTDAETIEVRSVCKTSPERVLPPLCDRLKAFLAENGCPDARFTWSAEPLIPNSRGGKIPLYVKL